MLKSNFTAQYNLQHAPFLHWQKVSAPKGVKGNNRTYRCKAHLRFLFIAPWWCTRAGSPFACFCLFLSGARVCSVSTQGLYTNKRHNLAFKINSSPVTCVIIVSLNRQCYREWIEKALLNISWLWLENFAWPLHCNSRNITPSLPSI